MKKCSSIFSIILCLFSHIAFSQNRDKINLLLKQQPLAGVDSQSVRIYTELAYFYLNIDVDSASFFISKAFSQKECISSLKLLSTIYNRYGLVLQKKKKWEQAGGFLIEGLKIREDLAWRIGIGLSMIDLANMHHDIGVQLVEVDNDLAIENFKTGIEYCRGAEQNFKSAGDEVGAANAIYSAGRCFYGMGRDSLAIGEYRRSIPIYIEYDEPAKLFRSYLGIVRAYDYLDENDSVRKYQKLVNTCFQNLDNRGKVHHLINKATDFLSAGNYDSTIVILAKADSIALNLGDYNLIMTIESVLSNVYENVDNWEDAMKHLRRFYALKHEMLNSTIVPQLRELELKYKTEKSKKLIAIRDARNIQNVSIFSILTVFLIGALFWLNQVGKKNKLLIEEQNQKKLKELEIQSLENLLEVRDTERKRIAEDLHDRLGNTLTATRMLFESSQNGEEKADKAYQLLDKAIAETRHIAYNMLSGVLTKFGLEAALEDLKATVEEVSDLQFGLSYENLDERLNAELELNIYRIIQELLSNSLKYAQASQLNVSLKRVDEDVEILIEDDGEGFDTNIVSHGMGMKNIETRVKKFKGNWSCNSIKGKGTRTTINFTLYETTDQNFNSG